MGGKKTNPAPPRERQPIQSTRLSLFCSLHFVLFSSLLICFGFLHTVFKFSRTDPLPPRPSPPALRAQQECRGPEGSEAAAEALLQAARKVRPAGGSHQLLSTSAARLGEAERFLRVSPRG